MEMSASIKELAAALAKAQGEMKPAEMTATNPFLKNKYADLGEIVKAAKPALAKFGLAVAQPVSSTGEQVTVTTVLMHESGEWMRETISLPLGEARGKSQAQEAGSLITYLRRYSLAAMIGMYADEDTDGNDGDGKGKTGGGKKTEGKADQPPATTGTNGNGKRSDEPPAPVDPIKQAEDTKTMKGARLGDMTTEQLKKFRASIETFQAEHKGEELSAANAHAYDAALVLINHRQRPAAETVTA